MRRTVLMVAAAVGALALAGCSNGATGGSAGSGGSASSSAGTSASATELKTFASPLGAIVVDGKGMTVYAFDKDTTGSSTSACTGACVSLWPAVTTTASSPSVQGVTGSVGTAPTADGGKQLTLDGRRLYTFSGDSGSGQVSGQGYQNIWWVVSPAGQEIKQAASSSSASSSASMGYSY